MWSCKPFHVLAKIFLLQVHKLQSPCTPSLLTTVSLPWACSSLSMPFLHCGAPNWSLGSRCGLTAAGHREESHGLLAVLLPMEPRALLASTAAKVHCWPGLSCSPAITAKDHTGCSSQCWTQSWRENMCYFFPSWVTGWVVLLGGSDLNKY